jgi:hypothetical protein
MSRNIDWSQPLSEGDRVWVSQFPAMTPLVEANDAQFASAEPTAEEVPVPVESEEDDASYDNWTVADLRAEIDRRNKEFGTTMSTSGKRDDLVSRLTEDDANADGAV